MMIKPSVSAPHAAIIRADAEMDLTNAPLLREELLTACRTNPVVVVDMSGTVFCDSSAVRTLVEVHEQATTSGGELRLVVASPALLRILAVIGVDQLLTIFSSLPEALGECYARDLPR